ncbi:MAG TPA: hypothetical protein VGF84_12655 [Micromonosporaceae bacterium]
MRKRNEKPQAARKNGNTSGGHATRNALLGTVAVAGIAGAVRYVSKHRGAGATSSQPSALIDTAADATAHAPSTKAATGSRTSTNAGPSASIGRPTDTASIKSLAEPVHHN